MLYRRVDLVQDEKLLLEAHCEVNFVCETEEDRRVPYQLCRRRWLDSGQPEGFLAAIRDEP